MKRALAKRRGSFFKCILCGREFWRKPFDIKKGNNKYCSKACYFEGQKGKSKDVSKRVWHIGEKNPMWKGGITPANQKMRHSLTMKEWRLAVFERDNWTCCECGARSAKGNYVRIEAHHVKPFATFPELRVRVDNGMTLCKKCHDLKPKGREIYSIK